MHYVRAAILCAGAASPASRFFHAPNLGQAGAPDFAVDNYTALRFIYLFSGHDYYYGDFRAFAPTIKVVVVVQAKFAGALT